MNRSMLLILISLVLVAASSALSAWPPQGYSPGPGAQAPPAAYGAPHAASAPSPQRPGRVSMRQTRTDDHYLLEIALGGMSPENIQVRAVGQSLVVRAQMDARERLSQTSADGRSYRESYRIASGGSTRRLPVPPDGAVAHFQREDAPDRVRILIPRRSAETADDGRFGSSRSP